LLLQFKKYSERFLLAIVERLDGDDGGVGDRPHTSRGLCGEAGAQRIGALLEGDCRLDLQGEPEKMEMKKSIEFIGEKLYPRFLWYMEFMVSIGANPII
jgi:hypothetical protein